MYRFAAAITRVVHAPLRVHQSRAAGGALVRAKTLRIEPALNIPRVMVDEVLEKLEDTLEELTD